MAVGSWYSYLMPATTNNTGASRGKGTIMALICSTCGQVPAAPYRRIVGGVVTEGCVSAAHDGHHDAWGMRPEAVAIRATPKAWGDLVPA